MPTVKELRDSFEQWLEVSIKACHKYDKSITHVSIQCEYKITLIIHYLCTLKGLSVPIPVTELPSSMLRFNENSRPEWVQLVTCLKGLQGAIELLRQSEFS